MAASTHALCTKWEKAYTVLWWCVVHCFYLKGTQLKRKFIKTLFKINIESYLECVYFLRPVLNYVHILGTETLKFEKWQLCKQPVAVSYRGLRHGNDAQYSSLPLIKLHITFLHLHQTSVFRKTDFRTNNVIDAFSFWVQLRIWKTLIRIYLQLVFQFSKC